MAHQSISSLILKAIQLKESGDWLSAIALLESDADAISQSADVQLCLGALYLDSGQPAPALESFDRVIALAPGAANAWYNRANALSALKRMDESLVAYRRCVRLEPAHVEAYINMGVLLQGMKRFDEAVACYDAAIQHRPDAVNAIYNRALAYENMGEFHAAVTGYEHVLGLAPNYTYLIGRLHHAKMRQCDWSSFDAEAERVHQQAASGQRVVVPFPFLAMSDNPLLQRQCADVFVADKFPGVQSYRQPVQRKPGRIRVGYFSADFRTHAVGFLTAGLFEAHARDHFEVYAFALGGAPEGDAYRQRIVAGCEHFIDASNITDAGVVEIARSAELDIAVDLAGHTLDARTHIFAQRVAPIQVNYLGYPGSMGAPYMDVILADPIVVPEGSESAFKEKVMRLPTTFQMNDRARQIGSIQPKSSYGLPESGLVFASFNTSYKLNPALFDSWCRILNAAPESVLWLIGESANQTHNLIQEAAVRGIDASRLVFAGRATYEAHLARYAHVDLVLDTYPFNGGTSTSDALWGGAPVLTCAGKSFASRMSASLLHAVNLPALVTDSLGAYETMALELVAHPELLAQYKSNLQAGRLQYPLFDTQARVRDIEAVYRALVFDPS